jgi:hypothetical protein
MNLDTKRTIVQKVYQSPSLRLIETKLDTSFLQSNTEPIDDDGQEHGWD